MLRTLVVSTYASLDGVVQDPVGMENSGLGNWIGPFNRGAEGDTLIHEELWAADILLLGRTTYDGFAAVWPSIDDPAGFARKLNAMRKYVASMSPEQREQFRKGMRARCGKQPNNASTANVETNL